MTDSVGTRREADVGLPVYGPIAAVDSEAREVVFCFERRHATVQQVLSFEIASVLVGVRLEAADVSRMTLTLISPHGTEAYLTTGWPVGPAIDTVFGAEIESLEPLDVFAGENAAGTWTLTLYDPRCPYPSVLDELAVVLEPREGPGETLVVEGWTPRLGAGLDT